MRCRCVKRGRGGSGIAFLDPSTEVGCDTVTVRCSHCGERADKSLTELVLRGKRTLRLEKPEGCTESTKGFGCGMLIYIFPGESVFCMFEGGKRGEERSLVSGKERRGESQVVQLDLH